MLRSSKKRIIAALSSVVLCSTVLAFAISSFAWFADNKKVDATDISIKCASGGNTFFVFSMYMHDLEDVEDNMSGFEITPNDDRSYSLKMNAFDSIFNNIDLCGVVVKAEIQKLDSSAFVSGDTLELSILRDESLDGPGPDYSSYISSVISVEATTEKPATLSDSSTDGDEIYRKASKMFIDNSYTTKTFVDTVNVKKENIVFNFDVPASAIGQTSFVMYFYLQYNFQLVQIYQHQHYIDVDPLSETIPVPSDIKLFMAEVISNE